MSRLRMVNSLVLGLIFVLGTAGISLVSAQEGYYVYDDFDDGVINKELWGVSGPVYENNGKVFLSTEGVIAALKRNLIGMSFSVIGHQNIVEGEHINIHMATRAPDGDGVTVGMHIHIVPPRNPGDPPLVYKNVFCTWCEEAIFDPEHCTWVPLYEAQWDVAYTFGLEYTQDGSVLVLVNGNVVHSFYVKGGILGYTQGAEFWFKADRIEPYGGGVTAEIDWATAKFIPPQRCVGAEGSQCAWPVRLNRDGSYTGTVSVGSILHDNCCIANYPHGYMCNNGGADQIVCRGEWSKAISNVITRRGWMERRGWGPYAEGEGDDITLMPARRSEPQANYETAKTLEFAAPPNTRLDITDEDFCESKRFRRLEPRRGFGICE